MTSQSDTREPAAAASAVSPGDRLVESPVFVLFAPRSGSTLLRLLLDTHPRIRAPHELWLRTIRVKVPLAMGGPAMRELGLDERELEHLLWDRVLHRELVRSGKDLIVDKSPFNAQIWDRLAECWPRARFIFLLRHPAAIVDSFHRLVPRRSLEKTEREVLSHARAVETARRNLAGHTIRYEDFVTEPEREIRALCEYLGVTWEPQMLEYGTMDHGPIRHGFGDASEQVLTGRIVPARPLPPRSPQSAELREIISAWGFDQV